ncbi:MAG: heterodisulfide reductase [Acidobacteria bacterium]|nr:heterodisulfide reductase [Acidobacteriota bacterium]NIM64135.1 heterodisulfide reductase [Acidobacteriota bacterium]NIO59414.1 heterodisulfide reductase [Acidobacteriota bacterium]NIQ30449.1 heterodisulfide reductase [Acidobacteriota bacterium]NIQ85380.1 heterodisulfide reductase [Acidobacteriota bacterium]
MRDGRNSSQLRLLVEQLSQQSILACYQCGCCSAGCPMAPWMDALPNQLIRRLQLGRLATNGLRTPWVCASCLTCGVRCPKGIDVPRVMEALRTLELRSGEDHVGPSELAPEHLRSLPQIALVAHMRKATG